MYKRIIEMPAPEASFVSATTESNVSFGVEPAFNALHSLMLLTKVDHLSGLDEWVTRTAVALPPDRRYMNQVVLIGVHYPWYPRPAGRVFALSGSGPAKSRHLRDRVLLPTSV
jgi:hypothetical protein